MTLGVRESYDEKEFSSELFASDNFIPQIGGSTTVSAEDDWNATDCRATVDFNITDDFMLYVTTSKAFRSGTFSVPGPVSASNAAARACTPFHRRPQPGLVPPETLLNDEIGFRSEWFDGRLRFNATYYEMELHEPARRVGRRRRLDPDGVPHRPRQPGRRRSLGQRDRGDVRGHRALHDRGRDGTRQLRDVEPVHQQRPVSVPAADG